MAGDVHHRRTVGESPERGGEGKTRMETLDIEMAENERPPTQPPKEPEETFQRKAIILATCFIGLQISFLTWGVLQEKVMTTPYRTGMFPSSTFCVFGNRFLAIFVAAAFLYYPVYFKGQKLEHSAPFYWYSPCSLSNVLSSWAQYECLKYVSFPVQVVSKSCKVIPVMLVGKMVHRKTYDWVEYSEAFFITLGVSIFTLAQQTGGAHKEGDAEKVTTAVGVFLLAMYLTCDSFTSQWQSRVYSSYHVNQFQMMLGVNCFSVFFTVVTLLQTGEGIKSLRFLGRNPEALVNILTLSVCSATGQLFIYYTIKKFGPIVFTIIMTTRQMLSMVISCIVYDHPMSLPSVFGALIVFTTIGYRIRRQYNAKKKPANNQPSQR
eukprot:CAMPEP_0113943626 /NCGR_PEP_ID=MMETSP1339-20121228/26935_1 /TAXON_ID=94617 /ORGANISM="Fibrocapsa japonica" /LENGTH=377 /DNA_ID=CAMNT_0000948561 /DNA_START=119 /DNA_END=1252 /DNA_ORIENTATION=+ /assembly_acc=CAM_ASM_000762